MPCIQKPPRPRRAQAPERAVLFAGSVMLAALLGMSLGTALLPTGTSLQEGLLVMGGLLLMLGSELWLLHTLQGLAPPQPPHTGRRGGMDHE